MPAISLDSDDRGFIFRWYKPTRPMQMLSLNQLMLTVGANETVM